MDISAIEDQAIKPATSFDQHCELHITISSISHAKFIQPVKSVAFRPIPAFILISNLKLSFKQNQSRFLIAIKAISELRPAGDLGSLIATIAASNHKRHFPLHPATDIKSTKTSCPKRVLLKSSLTAFISLSFPVCDKFFMNRIDFFYV